MTCVLSVRPRTSSNAAARRLQTCTTAPHRKIIHIDIDAFYAFVEQRDNPDLRGKPVAVGGSAERGVVAAASYEARKFGVRSAIPSMTAKRQCASRSTRQIREIFAERTPIIEPLSLDEAYLDVTENLQYVLIGQPDVVQIASGLGGELRLRDPPDRFDGFDGCCGCHPFNSLKPSAAS